MIKLSQVCKSYGNHVTVNNVSFEVPTGEILVLLGSSGCGKTTTLKMINRLIEPTSGSIEIQNVDVRKRDPVELRRSIGYVFQGIGLFPHMNVEENITCLMKLMGKPSLEREKRAKELLLLMNLPPEDYSKRYYHELSGGQRQRVGVARALALNPDYLLMDEPFGALDAITRSELQEEVLRLNQQLGKTIIFVTHDIFEALRLGNKIAVMNKGVIEQLGTPGDILNFPKTDFVKKLFETPLKQLHRLKNIDDTYTTL